ncbi:MAG TPA: GNAT family N-acetyltransferase, partial [Gaiellaceae bacterium]|nr:GNAT family N-acetyltransferase [Gaiellaceae bacterium]
MAIEVRAVEADEVGKALAPIWHYFGGRPEAEEVEKLGRILPPERVLAAVEGDEIVGGAGAYLFDSTVPGGAQVPTAGVMAVGVLPTHRRRGALTALMRKQLADAHERGEPIATLFAAEGGIYARFGYGLASLAGDIELPKEHARPWKHEPLGIARLLDTDDELLEVVPGI